MPQGRVLPPPTSLAGAVALAARRGGGGAVLQSRHDQPGADGGGADRLHAAARPAVRAGRRTRSSTGWMPSSPRWSSESTRSSQESIERVELSTQGIAGDIGVTDRGRRCRTDVRLGDVVVDVHQLQSDNSLRDKAIRHRLLESHDHREVATDRRQRHPPRRLRPPIASRGDDRRDAASEEGRAAHALDDRRVGRGRHAHGHARRPRSRCQSWGSGRSPRWVWSRPATRSSCPRARGRGLPELLAADRPGRAEPSGAADGGDGPAFSTEVAPILEANCASCHQTGSIGASMWTLDDAGDAAEVADGLAVVTEAGYMPPWPASDAGIPFRHSRGLTDDEIAVIAEWADAGAVLDVPGDTPVEVARGPRGPPAPARPRGQDAQGRTRAARTSATTTAASSSTRRSPSRPS